jgi:hypothetical protein
MKFAPLKKTIYSLGPLRGLLAAANRRYLEFLSAIDDPSSGIDKLNKIARTVHQEARSYRGFNFFDPGDEALFLALAAESSPSAACTTRRCAPASRNTAVARSPGFCAGCASTASSKRRPAATSTTSRHWANRLSRWDSNSRSWSSFQIQPSPADSHPANFGKNLTT